MIDRRELIQRTAAMLGGAVSAGAALGILSGCASSSETALAVGSAGRFLTAEEARNVSILADQIMPRTDTPGAVDVGVPAFIDRMMADYYEETPRGILRAGLARVENDAQTQHGKGFAAITSDQQVALMTVYDREAYEQTVRNARNPDADPHFFRILKELTTLGYFTSEAGATAFLRYDPIPGPYRADVPYSEIGSAWTL